MTCHGMNDISAHFYEHLRTPMPLGGVAGSCTHYSFPMGMCPLSAFVFSCFASLPFVY